MKKFTIRGKIFPIFGWTLMFAWSLIFLVLLLWSTMTSFKSIFDFYLNPVWLPIKENGGWMLENYATAINAIQKLPSLKSIFIAFSSAAMKDIANANAAPINTNTEPITGRFILLPSISTP